MLEFSHTVVLDCDRDVQCLPISFNLRTKFTLLLPLHLHAAWKLQRSQSDDARSSNPQDHVCEQKDACHC